jgi:hypothetical protein
MNLPEQGISGPFRITTIKHLLPQKRPEDEDAGKGFVFRPVTGIFTHQSNDVWTLAFDSGDTLGVTASHPIYSTTAQDWRLAGELALGEQVLTHTGSATLTGKRPAPAQRVYNLEVQEVHNFLVAEVGVVVHNGCMGLKLKLFFGEWTPRKQPGTQWVDYIEESGKLTISHEIDQLESLGGKLQKRMIGLEKSTLTNRPFPAIDGFVEGGRAISLKTSESYSGARTELRKMCTKANDLNNGEISGHEHLRDIMNDGIEGMISPRNGAGLSKSELQNAWNSILGDHQIDSDIVEVLYVQGSDGWLKWTKQGGWGSF